MGCDAQKFVLNFIGYFQLEGLLSALLIQKRIANGDRRLAGKSCKKINLVIPKLMRVFSIEGNQTENFVFGDQRNAEIGNQPFFDGDYGIGVSWIRLYVSNSEGDSIFQYDFGKTS